MKRDAHYSRDPSLETPGAQRPPLLLMAGPARTRRGLGKGGPSFLRLGFIERKNET